jgi:hypothetical protein
MAAAIHLILFRFINLVLSLDRFEGNRLQIDRMPAFRDRFDLQPHFVGGRKFDRPKLNILESITQPSHRKLK